MRECPIQDGSAAELMVAYGARALDPNTELAFERHMAKCSNCRELAAAQRELWHALDYWTPIPVSPDFDEKLFRRIAEEEQRAWWQRLWAANWSWRPAMPVAAACAVLAVFFLLKNTSPAAAPVSPAQPNIQIEQVEHALDDIDLLTNLGVATPTEGTHSTERI